jgi:DnaK suppressor protein
VKATPKTKTAAKPAAKAAKPAPKSAAKKAVQAAVKKPSKPVSKPVAKKPAKPAAKVAPKAVAKKATKPAAKPVAKKVTKPAAKPVAKKAVKPAAKPVAKKVVKPAAHPVTKSASKPVASKTTKPAVTAVAKKAAAVAKPVPAPKAVASKPVVAAPAPVAAPAVAVEAARKFTGRAAKAAAGVPPPPSAVPFSNPAKASFGPATESRMPALVPVIPKKDAKLANNWKNKPVEQLSDAEVLAMPDAEYMNDTQMAFFRLKLQQLKREILASAGETTEHLREDTVIVPDPADRATIEEEHALELRTRDRERKLLKKIEQSIQRIDLGDYGYCDETGEPIGVARLLARPTATLSLEAQQRRELKQKMFGD